MWSLYVPIQCHCAGLSDLVLQAVPVKQRDRALQELGHLNHQGLADAGVLGSPGSNQGSSSALSLNSGSYENFFLHRIY